MADDIPLPKERVTALTESLLKLLIATDKNGDHVLDGDEMRQLVSGDVAGTGLTESCSSRERMNVSEKHQADEKLGAAIGQMLTDFRHDAGSAILSHIADVDRYSSLPRFPALSEQTKANIVAGVDDPSLAALKNQMPTGVRGIILDDVCTGVDAMLETAPRAGPSLQQR